MGKIKQGLVSVLLNCAIKTQETGQASMSVSDIECWWCERFANVVSVVAEDTLKSCFVPDKTQSTQDCLMCYYSKTWHSGLFVFPPYNNCIDILASKQDESLSNIILICNFNY